MYCSKKSTSFTQLLKASMMFDKYPCLTTEGTTD